MPSLNSADFKNWKRFFADVRAIYSTNGCLFFSFLFLCRPIQTLTILIIAKPKIGTLFSLGAFIVLSVVIASFTASHMIGEENIAWYQYLIVIVLFPLALGLATKLIFGYKIIEVGKEKIDIFFPTRFKRQSYKIKEIDFWQETQVKTATGTYKEVQIQFADKKKLSLSYQEHTEYPQVIKYLKKKCAKKMKKG